LVGSIAESRLSTRSLCAERRCEQRSPSGPPTTCL